MKGKKILFVILIVAAIVTLITCLIKIDSPKHLKKEGIMPYQLSDDEKYILQSFGMEDNSQIISFRAPEEVITLNVNVYKLENGASWGKVGGGGISIGTEREPMEQFIGNFTMQLKDNYAIDFNVNGGGRASYTTDEIIPDTKIVASTKSFLSEFQEIEINKEIPVALIVYDSGTSMRSYTLQDYYDPSVFEGMDLVQVVTLTFTDKAL